MTAEPDQQVELIQLAREGDPATIGELYAQYKGPVFGVALRMLDSVQDAEDVTHDVFLELPTTLKTYEGRGRLESWLTRVAARKALMLLRHRKIRREVWIDGWPSALRTNTMDRAAERITLEDALRLLPNRLRHAVVLKMVAGLTYTEIAESLGIRINAAKARVHRARKLLRAHLKDDR